MKTIHHMTKEEFMQVFGYFQNNKKLILFEDKESLKDFIEVARKHNLIIPSYLDKINKINKNCPYCLILGHGSVHAWFATFSHKDIFYKKGSYWIQEETAWIDLDPVSAGIYLSALALRESLGEKKRIRDCEKNKRIEVIDTSKCEFKYSKIDGEMFHTYQKDNNCQEKETVENLTVTADDIINSYSYVLNIEVDLDEVAKDWHRTKTDIKELEKEVVKMAEVIDGLINLNIAIPKELADIFHQKNEELKKLR